MSGRKVTYRDAGVDIDAGKKSVELIREAVGSTHSSRVLAGVGAFGGLFDMSEIVRNYENPVLVQSIDGVGTKLMIASMAGDHTTIGMDIVNHGCDDILCQGARPHTFLDYIAMSRLDPRQVAEIVAGMAEACRKAGVAIIGGETAELPGMYRENEYDVAGVMTGVVEKEKIIDGSKIRPGDVLIGLASNGLHTNGYTLARKVVFEIAGLGLEDIPEGCGKPAGKLLLEPHINYAPAVLEFLESWEVRGMAHITGGGIAENLARILPERIEARVNRGSWPVLPLFEFIQKAGNVPQADMERTFNMGIGFILVIDEKTAGEALEFFAERGHYACRIGEIAEADTRKATIV